MAGSLPLNLSGKRAETDAPICNAGSPPAQPTSVVRWAFLVDPDATPGNLLTALAGLLIDLLECKDDAGQASNAPVESGARKSTAEALKPANKPTRSTATGHPHRAGEERRL
jgi:hypothetical protein